MKSVLLIVLCIVLSNCVCAQVTGNINQWMDNAQNIMRMNKPVSEYKIRYKVTNRAFDNPKIIDSLFLTAYNYTDDANNYNRSVIVVIIKTKSILNRPIKKSFDVGMLMNDKRIAFSRITTVL